MEFEYDPKKSVLNKTKHGIDFEEAKSLWRDERRLIIPAKSESEPRFAAIGAIPEFVWTAFFTMRGPTIRIISCRRASKEERKLYDEYE